MVRRFAESFDAALAGRATGRLFDARGLPERLRPRRLPAAVAGLAAADLAIAERIGRQAIRRFRSLQFWSRGGFTALPDRLLAGTSGDCLSFWAPSPREAIELMRISINAEWIRLPRSESVAPWAQHWCRLIEEEAGRWVGGDIGLDHIRLHAEFGSRAGLLSVDRPPTAREQKHGQRLWGHRHGLAIRLAVRQLAHALTESANACRPAWSDAFGALVASGPSRPDPGVLVRPLPRDQIRRWRDWRIECGLPAVTWVEAPSGPDPDPLCLGGTLTDVLRSGVTLAADPSLTDGFGGSAAAREGRVVLPFVRDLYALAATLAEVAPQRARELAKLARDTRARSHAHGDLGGPIRCFEGIVPALWRMAPEALTAFATQGVSDEMGWLLKDRPSPTQEVDHDIEDD